MLGTPSNAGQHGRYSGSARNAPVFSCAGGRVAVLEEAAKQQHKGALAKLQSATKAMRDSKGAESQELVRGPEGSVPSLLTSLLHSLLTSLQPSQDWSRVPWHSHQCCPGFRSTACPLP